eukprot:scaffold10667_cov132-Isochrysis_galbana.AAC.5
MSIGRRLAGWWLAWPAGDERAEAAAAKSREGRSNTAGSGSSPAARNACWRGRRGAASVQARRLAAWSAVSDSARLTGDGGSFSFCSAIRSMSHPRAMGDPSRYPEIRMASVIVLGVTLATKVPVGPSSLFPQASWSYA